MLSFLSLLAVLATIQPSLAFPGYRLGHGLARDAMDLETVSKRQLSAASSYGPPTREPVLNDTEHYYQAPGPNDFRG